MGLPMSHVSRFTPHISRITFHVSRFTPYALLAGLVLLFFHKLAFSNLILGRGDTFLYFYPYWHAAAARLGAGEIPLWNPYLFMGSPFLANSQAGVLYPLNWPFWLLLPTPYAVSASILLHLVIAGWGTYRLGKDRLELGDAAAFLAATLFALGGYITAQVEHVNQLQGLAWLPWVIWGVSRFRFQVSGSRVQVADMAARVGWVGLFLALQLLAGHTQTAFITGVGAAAVVAGLAIYDLRLRITPDLSPITHHVSRLIHEFAPLFLGGMLAVGVAAAQILPTLELTNLSSRQGGLSFNEVVSFSLHPLLLSRTLLPSYGQGLFTEYVAFLPLTALLLALVGAWEGRRDRVVWPVLLLTGLGLFLALGQFNPAYWLIGRLPGFDLFRVPARWLALYSLGVALLAGIGWEKMSREQWAMSRRQWLWGGILLIGVMVWGVVAVPLTRFIPTGPEAPPSYPSLLTGVGWSVELIIGYWLLGRGRWRGVTVSPLLLIAVSLYLASRTLPYHANPTTPEAFFDLRPPVTMVSSFEFRVPGSAAPARFLSLSDIFFDVGDQTEIDTIYAERLSQLARFDYTVAIKQKEVIAPNLSLLYGLAAADGFDGGILPLQTYSQVTSLMLPEGMVSTDGRLREYLTAVPEARWLDLFNIGYLITDKVGDAWYEGVFFDLQHPVTLTDAAAVGYIPSYEATELRLVADGGDFGVNVTTTTGQTWPLTPEPLAESVWRIRFPEPAIPTTLTFSPTRPLAHSPTLFGLSLVDSRDDSFQPLVLGQYRLIHSGDVKIYQNLDVLPRAFLVSEWEQVADAAAAVTLMGHPSFDPTRQAVVSGGQLAVRSGQSAVSHLHSPVSILAYHPEYVTMTVDAAAPALLILTDAYYPGWQASLNGEPVPIHQVNGLFRGVFVPAGEHQVEMVYRPESWERGRVISLVTILLWSGGLALWWHKNRPMPAVDQPEGHH